jgi:FAD-linked sulfhydryl oxidase
MHTAAAWYPERPSAPEQQAARDLVRSLALLYPCTHCVEDFRAAVQESPPAVESRPAFAAWLCHQHNLVNKKLGKV